MDDILTHLPSSAVLWSLQLVLTALVLSSTAPKSWICTATLPLLVLYTAQIVLTVRYDMRKPWASLIGGGSVCWLFQYFDVAILKGYNAVDDTWDVDDAVPASTATATATNSNGAAKNSTAIARLNYSRICSFKRGYLILANLRRIDTAQQVRNVPPFRSADPLYVPSRAALLKRSAIIIVCSYLALDVLGQTPKMTPAEHKVAFHPPKMPFFARIFFPKTEAFPIETVVALKAELVQRLVVTAGLWVSLHRVVQVLDIE